MYKIKMIHLALIFLIGAFIKIPCYSTNSLIVEQDAGNPAPDLQVERWNVFQLNLDGPQNGNPYKEVELSAEFRCGDKIYRPQGFYDGSGVYRIRIMPTKTGQWRYVTRSNKKELDGLSGTFECVEAARSNHGPVRVRNTFHLGYADGTPYWQIGTTCYAWVHQTQELQEQTLQTLKASPFNKIRMCVFPKDYNYNKNEPPFYPFPRTKDGINDFTRFNPAFFNHFEARIMDLMNLGIEADIILFHPYDRWGYQSMGAETDDFYLKYVIARFAAFRNVWWSLANEFDLIKSKTEYDWDRFFKIISEFDPYHHMAGIHNCIRFYDHTQPWVTHASIQSSELQRAREWREQYQKPVIYDECRYEGNIWESWGNQSAQEMVEKFWLGTIAGCYVGHGETYKHPQDILWWSKGGVLHGLSPARIAFLKGILQEAPADGIEPIDKYSGGKVGDYYLYYFGRENPKEWRINLPDNIKFKIELIDTWNMKITKMDGIFSGSFTLNLPGMPYQALRVRKVGYYFPLAAVQISPKLGLFEKSVTVRLQTSDVDAKIHYTLDGSIPTKKSPLYSKPILIRQNTLLNAISFNDRNEKSKMTSVHFKRTTFKTPVKVEKLSAGIRYAYYEDSWNKLPDFAKLKPLETGLITEFTIDKARQRDHIGYVFSGMIKIETKGVYTFYCSSDDGSKMWLADSLIIENDGLHGDEEVAGQIGLQEGYYPIQVHFFENEGDEALTVSYEGPRLQKQVIPPVILFHEE